MPRNTMLLTIARHVARISSRRSTHRARVMWQIIGMVLFAALIPLAFFFVARFCVRRIRSGRSLASRLAAGVPAILAGSGILGWGASLFMLRAEGTAMPFAAPQRLMTGGPFRYCRNPIQLGTVLLYFGIGCLADSVGAGALMFLAGMIGGTAYHRLIEEKELRIRFGRAYERYRRETPFIIPRIPAIGKKRRKAA